MKQKFIIKGKLPSLNEYIAEERKSRYAAASMKKTYQIAVAMTAKAARLKRCPRPVLIHYAYYEPNRKRDKDNIAGFAHKVIQDALVQAKVLDGDGWEYIDGFLDEFHVDRTDPRIEVTLMC